MKWTIKYFLICTFLSGIFLTDANGNVFRHADSLMAAGLFRDARIELEKIVFFNPGGEYHTLALVRKAECYKQEQDFVKIYETLNRIFLLNQPDSMIFYIRYEKALAYYLANEPGRAVFELQGLAWFLSEPEKAARIRFLSALSYCDLKNWAESKNEAKQYLALTAKDSSEYAVYEKLLDNLFLEKNIPKTLSKKTAKNLSTFIPGGGQFYAGRVGEGILSFALHGGLLYFGVSQFLDKFYFTGYTAGFGLLQRLYTGNLQRVQDLVGEVNKKRYDEFYTELYNLLASTVTDNTL